ncbi:MULTISPECIES: hypothetical protein [unclassified Streptomyces]|nr:hypothetical protein [Streptomyces sp. YIM 132580]
MAVTADTLGNTGAASIPMALHAAPRPACPSSGLSVG